MKALLLVFLFLPSLLCAQGIDNAVTVEFSKRPASISGDFTNHSVVMIPGLNSPQLDYAPSITADGRILYFVSNRPGGAGGHDIWRVSFVGENLSDLVVDVPEPLAAPVNSEKNEGISAISADGRTLIFTACNRPDGVGDCDLYSATLQGGEWTDVRNLRPLNSSDWDSQPALSGSGDTIFFISNRTGALGGDDDADIYMAIRDGEGEWGTPVNLGAQVNTTSREDSPFIMPGTSTLYFSSSGYAGFGGLDFFRSTLLPDGNWTEAENLGQPLNTAQDERFISGLPDGSIMFFTSERTTPENLGTLDIFAAVSGTGNAPQVVSAGADLSMRPSPNPATDRVSFTLQSTGLTVTGDLRIYSATGEVVLRLEGYRPGDEVDIAGLAEGFYGVSLETTGQGTIRTTFVRRL